MQVDRGRLTPNPIQWLFLVLFAFLGAGIVAIAIQTYKGSPAILAAIDSVGVAAVESRKASERSERAIASIDSVGRAVVAEMERRGKVTRRLIRQLNAQLSKEVTATRASVDTIKTALPRPKKK